MTSFSQSPTGTADLARRIERASRKPQRLSVTVSWSLHQRLEERASYEGRSLSNLVAHLLEAAVLWKNEVPF
jgi:predicted HicB family RNase H-like nuclease